MRCGTLSDNNRRNPRGGDPRVEVRRAAHGARPARDPSSVDASRTQKSAFPKGTPLHSDRRSQRPQSAPAQRQNAQRPQSASRGTQRPNGQYARNVNNRPASPQVRANAPAVRPGRAPSASRSGGSRTSKYSVIAKTTVGELASEISKNVGELTSELSENRRRRIVAQNERREITERKRNVGVIRTRSGVDRVMLILILVLLALGTVAVFSASYPAAIADPKIDSSMHYIKRQLFFAGLGIAVMMIAAMIPPAFYKRASLLIFIVSSLLLALVPFIGIDYQGTKRWIGVPGTAVTVQPSEIMKAAIVFVLAWYLDKYRDKVTDRLNLKNAFVYGVLIPGLFIGVGCGLVIIEKHLSATVIVALIGLTVMLIGGSHIGMTVGGAALVGGAGGGLYLAKNPYALKRITSKMDEGANVLAERWQTTQGLYAIGNGGPFGVGLGSSIQKYSYVSEAHTDFIFTIWCEETGFVGALAVILLFMLFVWRGFKIAMHAPDTFSALTVYGLTAHVGIQALLNMLVVTDSIPNTGVSLPFFSYGGSSLIVLMLEMGVLLSISKHSFQKQ